MAIDRGHINAALTSYTVATAKNLDNFFIANQVAPAVRVPNMSDSYLIYGNDDLRIDSDIISLGGDVPRVSWAESDCEYKCQEYGMETVLKKALVANADAGMRYEQRRAAGLVRKIKLALEARVAAIISNPAVFTHTAALAVADRWDVATGDPVDDSLTALETIRPHIGAVPNTLIIGGHVRAHLRVHPDITSRLAGLVAGQPASDAQIASIMGVDRLLVGNSIYESALEGAAASVQADVWGNIAAFAYIESNPEGAVEGAITPLQRFTYEGFMNEFASYEYEEGALKRILGVYACYDLAVVAANSLYLFTTVVS